MLPTTNILSLEGVESIFLGQDFISINKNEQTKWDDIKHVVISLINDFYSDGKDFVIDENVSELQLQYDRTFVTGNANLNQQINLNCFYEVEKAVVVNSNGGYNVVYTQ